VTPTFAEAARRAWPLAATMLGWRPDDFWTATPAELAGALLPPQAGEGAGRPTLEALMARFPDDEE
jgi:uncharacterized phage protein (TIGR02216 family)